MNLREDCDYIVKKAIQGVMPGQAVKKALEGKNFGAGKIVVAAIGKAAWTMADAAVNILGDRVSHGVVVTKYDHSKGSIGSLSIYEAGHPIPDENSVKGARAVLSAVSGLSIDDTVLFLVSGGGSALFEDPLITLEDLMSVTGDLLARGADITEINTIRKRFSKVKGGRFAESCRPAGIFSVILSDVLGDKLDMIASGPAWPDSSTSEQAIAIADKYGLKLTDEARELLKTETPKTLDRSETVVAGSVRELCYQASEAARELGYEPIVLTDSLNIQAREAGAFLSSIARYNHGSGRSLAFIAGGETVVKLTGKGLGGRNQELALAAAEGIRGLEGTAVFSLGSDGTDGPTDAAGGYADGATFDTLNKMGISVEEALNNNDSYHTLKACGGLIITGPTGTNVNDVSIALIKEYGL